ncbi:thiaminase II [Pelagibaculum spongiae]|uniref:Aminopyrimidine aminohydrolase n=1 Tax=Pelagibaculum spongiae TaxID=2080658 RepID=A0A2V1GVN6_9GAMM|nr:thiaminase II [Pelagibaculum spongiae]PVZ69013.1 thiaminase II [Pelagibaculum spongiae]
MTRKATYQDLIEYCKTDWQQYIEHDFVKKLADGSLSMACFKHYLQQDYLFLKHYARAYALAVYKSPTLDLMRKSLPGVTSLVLEEISLHIDYCKDWGLNEADLEALDEDVATVAYTRYVLDKGMQGELADLYAALVPCAIGYAHIGQNLSKIQTINNPYQSWIDIYAGEDYQKVAQQQADFLDQLISEVSIDSQRFNQLADAFKTATRMEIAFWQQGLNQQ